MKIIICVRPISMSGLIPTVFGSCILDVLGCERGVHVSREEVQLTPRFSSIQAKFGELAGS